MKGTDQFAKMFRERHVEKCQELKRLGSCSECPVNEECEIRIAHLRDLR